MGKPGKLQDAQLQYLFSLVRYIVDTYNYQPVFICSGKEEGSYCGKLFKKFSIKGTIFYDLSVNNLLSVIKCAKLYIGLEPVLAHLSIALKIRTLFIKEQKMTFSSENSHVKIFQNLGEKTFPYEKFKHAVDELLAIKELIFVHKYDTRNTADKIICPLDIFKTYFTQKPYILHKFDVDELPFISFKKAVFVLGGGGLVNQNEAWNHAVNKLAKKNKVIGWGIGFNRHYDTSISEPINLKEFALLGLRDFNKTPYRYVPCPSCLYPALEKKLPVKRKIGAILHYGNLIDSLGYDTIYNDRSFEEIITFIAESEVILTNTYHMVYWSTLMGKKVILLKSFSERFKYFQYPPVFYSGDLESDIKQAKIYTEALANCRKLNLEFFQDFQNFLTK